MRTRIMVYSQAVNDFLHFLDVIRGASPHTLRNYRIDLEGFNVFFNKEISDLSQIDKRQIREYLAHLAEKGVAKRTVLRRLAALRSFFKHLSREKRILYNPFH